MGEPTVPVPTGISDITLATETAEDQDFPPLMPSGIGHTPNDILAVARSSDDAVFSPDSVDSLSRERAPLRQVPLYRCLR